MSTHAHRTHEHIFGLVYLFLFAFVRCVCLRERFHSCAIVCSMEPAVFYAFNQLTHNGEHTLIELVSMKPNIARAHFEAIGNIIYTRSLYRLIGRFGLLHHST